MSFLERISDLNIWIASHKELITVVAVPSLTWFVTSWNMRSQNLRSSKDREASRSMERAVKVAEFRRQWIEELREELGQIIVITGDISWNTGDSKEHFMGMVDRHAIAARILMRLNPTDAHYKALVDSVYSAINATNSADLADAHIGIIDHGQKMLKIEWDKLKEEMIEAEELK